jgi:hypothetical protein
MGIFHVYHVIHERGECISNPHPPRVAQKLQWKRRHTFIMAYSLAKAERRAVYTVTLSENPLSHFCGTKSRNEISERRKKPHGSLLQNYQTPDNRKI